ncbi:MAG TPA: SIR2 family protein, partial [Longimicrobium sp.]|nr:SIR2 family protein [Longimicrobium sp.]
MPSDPTDRLKLALGDDHFASVVEGIARGEYNLLLGAGASVGGSSSSGKMLPIGNELADELITDFDLPTDVGEKLSLTTAYEAAEHRISNSGMSFADWVVSRFSSCTPPDWQLSLPRFYWQAVWTLNIDDTVEVAYSRVHGSRQKTRVFNWTDSYKKSIGGEIQIIHLHGRAEQPDQLVFSIIEYLRAVRTTKTWHRMFGDHFQEQPFIVVGTRLANEFDLEEVLVQGSTSLALYGRPSLIVLREISQLHRERFARFGLIPVQMTSDAFFAALEEPVRLRERQAAGAIRTGDIGLTIEARTFLDQFSSLRTERPKKLFRRHDFYSGYDPEWTDIVDGLDATLDSVHAVVDELVELRAQRDAIQKLELIHGDWGTGKSTALLRIGREMIRRGMDVFLFRGEDRLNETAALWWVQHVPNSLLLVDGLGDFADDIGRLLVAAKEAKRDVLIVGADRDSRLQQIYSAIPAEFV